MSDSRFYRAHTARARCQTGDFTLLGRKLVPLSMAHLVLLEELRGDELLDLEPSLLVLDAMARICSEAPPTGKVDFLDEEQRTRRQLALTAQYDEREQRLIWQAYLDACYLARPFTRQLEGGGVEDYRAPWPLIVVTFLCRCAPGYTRDQLWYDMPVSEVLWAYEALREQHCGETYLTGRDEPDPEPTPEEKAEEERIRTESEKVLQDIMARRLPLLQQPPTESQKRKLKELNEEQTRRLAEIVGAAKVDS